MSWQLTRFRFRTADSRSLTLGSVMVYSVQKKWINAQSGQPTLDGNSGIGWLVIENREFDSLNNCIVSLNIDAKVVNDIPYASDGASLLFSVNNSNIHINIHSNGNMESTGIYGSNPDAIGWSPKLGKVGEFSDFILKKN